MAQIHIDEVYPKNTFYPMLVNFQNGYTTDNFEAQDIVLLENSKTGSKTLATEIDGLLYAGDEENEGLGKTFILARDKLTEKVRIIESGVVSLKPILNVKVNETQPLEINNLELSRKFGSKKQKQRMEHREKLKVNVETVTEQMQNVAEQITEEKLDLQSYNKADNDDFYIPPIDRTADTVDGVYDINKILTEEQYDKIYSELNGKDIVSDMVPFVKSIANKKLSPKHTVLAVYANALLQLYSTMVKEITKKSFTICPLSPTLNEYILTNFLSSSNSKRTRPAPFKDKSLCHAIVFLLLINNYKIEMEGLCEALKLTPNTASIKVRVTGASVITSGNKKMVHLKLPLNKTGFKRRSAKF
ncbi:uncharacterized protein LOC123666135 [Melitaea cinxia]|uniref:uncharacterized protein LOC123666135 n=1 Tax=Melitaea cinxia TaxID=113334 RepID=UPI001E273463|nr:uncharacterized protein LOC123666135 [Melitaea cinxia]